jgi:catechol 2,3-dioxygenase-like lactoylglutathione lyase family enzyme
MTSIHHVTLEADDVDRATRFYTEILGVASRVRVRQSDAPTEGFRGFTLGLDLAGPSSVDAIMSAALDAGAATLKAAQPQPWGGYSGVIQAPDGAIWKIATAANEDDGQGESTVERVVLLLGAADVRVTEQFYVERGLAVAKSAGGKYVEFEPGVGVVTLGLYKREGLAKEFGVASEGSGSRRVAIGGDTSAFTDPDGFAWEPATVPAV